MNDKRHPLISCRPRLLVLAMACALSEPVFAQNLPGGFTNVHGVDTPTTVGNTMTVTQTTQRGIAEWQSFSIGKGYSVIFNQPGSSSVLLNRVVGNDSSKIAGNLSANGQIYLINPNGVLFSQGSSVNVGGLIASTLNISNNDFLTGGALKFSRADNNDAAVTNEGSITATDGSIALMAARVTNSGTLMSASGGTVGLVSARAVNVDFDGDGLTTFTIPDDSLASAAWVENSGQVDADGGRIVLLAASTVREQVVKQSGTLRARSLSNRSGEIVLGGDTASGNEVLVSGEVDVSGNDAGVAGGTVSIDASSVQVEGARIDASGAGQGGSIAIRAQGAKGDGVVAVDAGSSLHADAVSANGNGGRIDLLADSRLSAHGTLTARAGAAGGDGGFIETSAASVDLKDIRVNASAPAGKAGTWLIDPVDIAIVPYGQSVTGYDEIVYDTDISSSLSSGTNVEINTSCTWCSSAGDITILDGVNIVKSGGGAATMTLIAEDSIYALGDVGIFIQSSADALNVVFNAEGNVYLNRTYITTNDGSITLAAAGNTGSSLLAGGGVIISHTTISGGKIDMVGRFSTSPGVQIDSYSNIIATGDVILRASTGGSYSATLRIDGQVSAGSVLNLRPVVESEAIAIRVTPYWNTFMSPADFANLTASTIVIGSSTHNGAITVGSPITTSSPLTLQNGSGGITLEASISAPTLGLVSAGHISQYAAITADNLFAYSSSNSVGLQSANNVGTLSGGAGTDFTFSNLSALTIGPVSVTGYDTASNSPQTLSTGTLTADAVQVIAYAGNLTLAMPVSSVSGTSLEAMSGRFQNPGSGSISGPWRVWAYTWVGETRGGMAGTAGNLPNIYGCAFGDYFVCSISGVAIPATGNHFLYYEQPTTTVTVNDITHYVGTNFPTPTFNVDNLIFPDDINGFAATFSTPATASSSVGVYPIWMDTFVSEAGYIITLQNGYSNPANLYVISESIVTKPSLLDLISETTITKPSPLEPEPVLTYAFMPVCLKTDEFDSSFKAVPDSDALAHEWARLRTRPRISGCLGAADRRKGCADF